VETSPLAEAVNRVIEADAEAQVSQTAFAAGKFSEHLQKKFQAIQQRISDEYDAAAGSS